MSEKTGKTKGVAADTETPLMKQYNAFKAKYPDAILLFRVGDFYETLVRMPLKQQLHWVLRLPNAVTAKPMKLNWRGSLTMR